MSISVVCRQCNKTYRVKDELAGKRGKCPQGHVLVLPKLDADVSPFVFSAAEPWPAEGAKSISDPASPKGKEQVPAPAGKSCPSCRANMSAKDVICVACGFDIRTGKKVASVAASEKGSQRTVLIAGIGAGTLIVVAIAISLLVLRGGPSGPTLPKQANQATEQEKETLRQAELARLKADQEKETLRQAELARLKAAEQPPKKEPAAATPFEEAFATGQIAWQGVKNTQLTTRTAGQQKIESTEFTVKFKYDVNGKRSTDTTGYKTYTWPDREATFGPGAVIRLTQNSNVREGVIRAGDEWTWTGQQWTAKPK